MGWLPSFKSNSTPQQQQEPQQEKPLTNYSPGQKILLQDTKPHFNDPATAQQTKPVIDSQTFKQAWNTLSWKEFTPEKLTEIPCFRDAGMVGFSSLFVVGSLMFIYHKNPMKATNWGLGSLLLGSMVGWEQCRLKRKHSFEIAQLAINTCLLYTSRCV